MNATTVPYSFVCRSFYMISIKTNRHILLYVDGDGAILKNSSSADLVTHHRDGKKRTPHQEMKRKRKADYLIPLFSLLPQPLQIPWRRAYWSSAAAAVGNQESMAVDAAPCQPPPAASPGTDEPAETPRPHAHLPGRDADSAQTTTLAAHRR